MTRAPGDRDCEAIECAHHSRTGGDGSRDRGDALRERYDRSPLQRSSLFQLHRERAVLPADKGDSGVWRAPAKCILAVAVSDGCPAVPVTSLFVLVVIVRTTMADSYRTNSSSAWSSPTSRASSGHPCDATTLRHTDRNASIQRLSLHSNPATTAPASRMLGTNDEASGNCSYST